MKFLVVENGIIVNIIVCKNERAAAKFNAVPYYYGASIGDAYVKPAADKTIEERVAEIEAQIYDVDALNVDQEYRLTMLELGLTE